MATLTFPENEHLYKTLENNKEKILDFVNSTMQKQNDLSKLIGKNDISFMFDNHKNHLDFMINIIRMNHFSLLEKTIPWVYATYSNKGFSFEYFPILFKAFIGAYDSLFDEKISRSVNQIYDYLLDSHVQNVKNAKSSAEDVQNNIPNDKNDSFLSSLISGRFSDCIEIADKSINNTKDIVSFYIDTVQPCMYDVGQLWHENKISVAHEHLASSIISRVMAYIYTKHNSFETSKGSGIISAVCNEYHEIGARMTADILDINGWNTKFLGSDTPVTELIKLLKEDKPDFLGLSVTMSFNLKNLTDLVTHINADTELENLKVILGGLIFNQNPDLISRFPHDGYAKDASDCLLLLEGWWSGNELANN